MKIACIRLSAVGDCCLLLPVVRLLLEKIEDANIYWFIDKNIFPLFEYCTHPRLHYIAIDKPKKISDYRNLKKKYSKIKFDCVFEMQASFRANLIYPLLSGTRKIGFDKIRARDFQWLFSNEKISFRNHHLHDSFLQFAEKLLVEREITVEKNLLDWSITLPKNIGHISDLPEDYIVINPAASKQERCWDMTRNAEVIDYIKQRYNLPVVLTGGKGDFEKELAINICQNTKSQPINLVAKTSLVELASVINNAKLVIAPDTGPAHIANAMQTPVIGLYAVASSKLSGPYHYRHLTIDKFDQAVAEILMKNPKTIRWKTRVHKGDPMSMIKVSEVVEKISSILG